MAASSNEPNAPKLGPDSIEFPCRIDNFLESYVTRLLEEAGIPSFIWAENYLSMLGSRTAIFNSAYVVPDEQIEKAAEVLDKAGFPPCIQEEKDAGSSTAFQRTPFRTSTEGVRFVRKSRLFWTFPEPCLGPPPHDDPYYMLVTDPRINNREDGMARGRQPEGLYPVKMAVPARYTEAMMLLQLRDLRSGGAVDHWNVEMDYLFDPDILGLNLDLDDLKEPFREWAKRKDDGHYADKVVKDPLGSRKELELYLDMKRRNELPPAEKRSSHSKENFERMLERLGVAYEESDLAYR